jgi:hypothetical protein
LLSIGSLSLPALLCRGGAYDANFSHALQPRHHAHERQVALVRHNRHFAQETLGLDQHQLFYERNNRRELVTANGGEVVREVFA